MNLGVDAFGLQSETPHFGEFFYYNVSNINTRERGDEIDRKEICG